MVTSVLASASALLFSSALAQQFVQYTPGGDDTSVQRADTILSYAAISQHVHQIWGSGSFSPSATYQSLMSQTDCTTVGDASNNGNAQDNSNYWVPALYMEAKDGSGYLRIPTDGHKLYYKNAGTGTPRSPFEFPEGFRMLAGNPFIRSPPSDLQQQNITQWICHDSTGSNQGTYGGFPTDVTDCDAYPGFNGALHFPHCWNGQSFNIEDPSAHVSYPTGDIENGDCPPSHPIRLPHIFVENQFNLHSMVDKVKPNTFVLAQGDNTGLGWHADFLNGWESGAIPALMDSCPQGDYGNEDIGLCPTFKKRSIPASDCKLKVTYHENVDTPGQHLPGCNPIVNTNPAPEMATAPLGACTDQCSVVNHGGSPPAYSSSPASYSSSSVAMHSTTLATYTKASSTASSVTSVSSSEEASPTSYTSSLSCPSSNHKMYKAPSGQTFQVQCGMDHYAGNLKGTSASSLEDCINQCDATHGCVDVSLSGTACYMKKSIGVPVPDSDIMGAMLIKSHSAGANEAGANKVLKPKPQVTSKPENNDTPGVVYVTEVVTVTAAAPEKRFERHWQKHARAHADF